MGLKGDYYSQIKVIERHSDRNCVFPEHLIHNPTMKTTLILLTLPAASAFAPSATTHTRVLRHQAVAEEETVIIEEPEGKW